MALKNLEHNGGEDFSQIKNRTDKRKEDLYLKQNEVSSDEIRHKEQEKWLDVRNPWIWTPVDLDDFDY